MEKNRHSDFVARHYREGAFSVRDAWRRLGIDLEPRVSRWRRWRVAAGIAVAVALGATAALVAFRPDTPTATLVQTPPAEDIMHTPHPITFDNATLPQVVAEIKKVYDVQISGLPANPESIVVTMHYDGSVTDLVATLNDTFELNLKISRK